MKVNKPTELEPKSIKLQLSGNIFVKIFFRLIEVLRYFFFLTLTCSCALRIELSLYVFFEKTKFVGLELGSWHDVHEFCKSVSNNRFRENNRSRFN